MKKFIFFIFIVLFFVLLILFVKNKHPSPIIIEDSSNVYKTNNFSIDSNNKNINNINTDIPNNNLNLSKNKDIHIEKIIEKLKSKKWNTNLVLDNFIQASYGDLSVGEINKNQCILNIVYKKSDLSICEFVKNECKDLECEKFDCDLYYKDWYKVSYYGDFIGSGDKELLYKNKDDIIIANLECDDKSLEVYSNRMFDDLIY